MIDDDVDDELLAEGGIIGGQGRSARDLVLDARMLANVIVTFGALLITVLIARLGG